MASKDLQVKERTLAQLAADLGHYPEAAYHFVQEGLGFTVHQAHGQQALAPDDGEPVDRHVSGQQLCEGLRQFALAQWGLLARPVLRRWNVTATLDFGRIVFHLIEAGMMQKTDEDTLEDFRGVFDFRTAFEAGYRIGAMAPALG